MKDLGSKILLYILPFYLLVLGCSEKHGNGPLSPDAPLNNQDVINFLRATPFLYGDIGTVEQLNNNEDSIRKMGKLDSEAQKFGYSSYKEYVIVYSRLTNALGYLKMHGNVIDNRQPLGETGLLKSDAVLAKMYADDIERVVSEARNKSVKGGR